MIPHRRRTRIREIFREPAKSLPRYRPKRVCRAGLTLIELLVALIILGLGLLPIFLTSSMANRSTMDSYYEFLAGSLAQEPIEVFRTLGYKWLAAYSTHPLEDFPLGWKDLTSTDWQKLPTEVGGFRRLVEIFPCAAQGDEPKALRVRVTISPKEASWLSRDQVVVEALIIEDPE